MESGILAPSADNSHQIRFESLEAGLRLWAKPGLSKATPRHRTLLNLISYGAIAENIILKSTEWGLACTVNWFPSPDQSGLIAEFHWAAAKTPLDELAMAIPLRHSNRRFYHGPRLSLQEQSTLEKETGHFAGVRLLWLDEKTLREKALRLIRIAETERFRSRILHHELFSSIRFDAGWWQTTEEGLPPGALEVEPLLRAPFAALRHWGLMNALSSIGFHRLLGLRAGYLPARLSPHLGMLVSDLELENGALEAGRGFERLWLRATLLGLAIQPMAAAVILAFQASSAEGASDTVRESLKTGWEEICPGLTPLMLFRLGHAKPPTLVAGRRPVEAYLSEQAS